MTNVKTSISYFINIVILWYFTKLALSKKIKAYHGQDLSTSGPYNYSQYQPYEKIESELHRIASTTNTSTSRSLFTIGKTFENRDLWALKEKSKVKKRMIVVDCGAHAREWLAPSTCMYLIKQFHSAENDQNKNISKIIRKFDWVFIPLLNPDGYVYTWHNKSTRLWRKNRSYNKQQLQLKHKQNNELCIGVDINRNFDKAWGGPGAPITNPCFEMYAGDKPFSERESTALANYLYSRKYDIIAYISLHSFGQAWMTPWGFTKTLPKYYDAMNRVANICVTAMKKLSGVNYTVGPSHDELYPNSGSSIDWAYSKLRIPYTYIVEMMPKAERNSSFMLPPHMMVKNSKDILEGLRTMASVLSTKQFKR